MLLGFVLTILMARTLGPVEFGIYSLVFTIASLLAVPAQFGIPKVVLRETVRAHVQRNWPKMLGLWRWSSALVLFLSMGAWLVAFSAAQVFGDQFNELQLTTFWWGLALVPLLALTSLRSAALQGIGSLLASQVPENIVRPAALILMILASLYFMPGTNLSSAWAMAFYVLSSLLTFLMGAWLLLQARPPELRRIRQPEYDRATWHKIAWPLALVAALQQVNSYADSLLLGLLGSASDVGIYKVALQGGILVKFGLQVISLFISPYFARLHAQGDSVALQRLVQVCARVSFLASLPVVLLILIWGKDLIALVFGREYVPAYMPLLILSFGQLVNTLVGPVGLLLSMTGHERATARGIAIAAFLSILLNVALIPFFGMIGAAIATSLSLALWNIILWWQTKIKLGIDCMAFGIFGRPSGRLN